MRPLAALLVALLLATTLLALTASATVLCNTTLTGEVKLVNATIPRGCIVEVVGSVTGNATVRGTLLLVNSTGTLVAHLDSGKLMAENCTMRLLSVSGSGVLEAQHLSAGLLLLGLTGGEAAVSNSTIEKLKLSLVNAKCSVTSSKISELAVGALAGSSELRLDWVRSRVIVVGSVGPNAALVALDSAVVNGSGIYIAVAAGRVEVHWSVITGNRPFGLEVAMGTVNATLNWWGCSGGPVAVGNPGGCGDKVVGDVIYSPWLTEPPPWWSSSNSTSSTTSGGAEAWAPSPTLAATALLLALGVALFVASEWSRMSPSERLKLLLAAVAATATLLLLYWAYPLLQP